MNNDKKSPEESTIQRLFIKTFQDLKNEISVDHGTELQEELLEESSFSSHKHQEVDEKLKLNI